MLTVANLKFFYGPHPILNDLSFALSPGIHSILGRSGSGKTSLLRCVAGLESYTGSIAGYTANQVGYLEQHLTLFPQFTISENIAYPLRIRHLPKTVQQQRTKALLEHCHLTHLANRYPNAVSGGEQRRAMLARVLSYQPQLLLCDEPFSALDSITRVELVRWFKTIVTTQQLTVLYVTHDLPEARYLSDTAMILEEGKIAAQGRWSELDHPLLASQF